MAEAVQQNMEMVTFLPVRDRIAGIFRGEVDVDWPTPERLNERFYQAWSNLIRSILDRFEQKMTSEAYKKNINSEHQEPWINIFNFYIPSKNPTKEKVTHWMHCSVISLFCGFKDEGRNTFTRLGVVPVWQVVKNAIESPLLDGSPSPFRVFFYFSGKEHGYVLQVRWDKRYSKSYLLYCQREGITPDIRPDETEAVPPPHLQK